MRKYHGSLYECHILSQVTISMTLVLRPEVTMVPYIRSYVLWFRQTSPVTGWTIKAITGYVTNYAEGCE